MDDGKQVGDKCAGGKGGPWETREAWKRNGKDSFLSVASGGPPVAGRRGAGIRDRRGQDERCKGASKTKDRAQVAGVGARARRSRRGRAQD